MVFFSLSKVYREAKSDGRKKIARDRLSLIEDRDCFLEVYKREALLHRFCR